MQGVCTLLTRELRVGVLGYRCRRNKIRGGEDAYAEYRDSQAKAGRKEVTHGISSSGRILLCTSYPIRCRLKWA